MSATTHKPCTFGGWEPGTGALADPQAIDRFSPAPSAICPGCGQRVSVAGNRYVPHAEPTAGLADEDYVRARRLIVGMCHIAYDAHASGERLLSPDERAELDDVWKRSLADLADPDCESCGGRGLVPVGDGDEAGCVCADSIEAVRI